MTITRVILCGGEPDVREFRAPAADECQNRLHGYPLPEGYVDAGDAAARRFRDRWKNLCCPDCGFYGWVPPAFPRKEHK